jgi:hypothetical protein
VHDRVGDQQAAEVVRGELQRLPGGAGEAGLAQGDVQQLADRLGGEGAVLRPEPPLEQQRHRRVPYFLVVVVGHDERDRAAVAADPGDDRRQDVSELGADDQKPFGVGLGRGDLQQRDELAGGREPVLDQAVVRQLGELLDPDAGMAERLDGGPGPEGPVLFEGQVTTAAVGRPPVPRPRSGRCPLWP